MVASLVGCSTPQSQSLRRIEVGMTKEQVLNLAGNPQRSGREHGQDRWVYINREGGPHDNESTLVYFSEGKVTYIGPTVGPFIENSDNSKSHHEETLKNRSEKTPTEPKLFKPVGE